MQIRPIIRRIWNNCVSEVVSNATPNNETAIEPCCWPWKATVLPRSHGSWHAADGSCNCGCTRIAITGSKRSRPKRQSGCPSKLPVEHNKRPSRNVSWPVPPRPTASARCGPKTSGEFSRRNSGSSIALPGVYDLLHRLGFSCLAPRPRHRKNDPAQMQQWVEQAPLLSRPRPSSIPARPVEVWFQDEARVGQQGTLTRCWGLTGSRPTAVKQTEYEWVYLFGAVNPLTGESSALLGSDGQHGVHEPSSAVHQRTGRADKHVILVLDRAGWHVAKALQVPENITLLHLPPYSPELNPVERLWAYLRSHYLSNRVYRDYDDLFHASGKAWNQLTPEHLCSICRTEWIPRTNQS